MASSNDYNALTDHLGLDDDCPMCGAAWAMCRGLCGAHLTLGEFQGPFHHEFNDDCDLCKEEAYSEQGCGADENLTEYEA